MEYKEQMEIFNKAGFIPTGYNGIWSDGIYRITIGFYPNRVEITNFEKIEYGAVSNINGKS